MALGPTSQKTSQHRYDDIGLKEAHRAFDLA
jgi:hypothetical protein